MLPVDQTQLLLKINELNNLESWGSWDIALVSENEITSIVKETFESLELCPNRSLSFSLLDLIKRIKSEDYIGFELKDLASKVQKPVYESIDLLGEEDVQSQVLKLLHTHENQFASTKPIGSENLGSVSKRWNKVNEEDKKQWCTDLKNLEEQMKLTENCKHGREAINLIIEKQSTVANLKKFPEITDELLEHLFENCKKIEHLIISGSKITKLPDACSSLKTLKCNFVNLKELPFMPNLNTLSCVYCLLTTLPPMPNLYSLECRGCPLTELPTMPNLYILDCADCEQLKVLPDMQNLRKLYCSGCPLTDLPKMPNIILLYSYNCPKLIEPTNMSERFPNCKDYRFKEW